MTTVALVIIASIAVVAILVGVLFGVVWYAGKAARRSQSRH